MVDFLTVELPDPVGLPVNAGEILRIDRDGQVEWTTPARLQVRGSWQSSMTFRAIGAETSETDEHRAGWELKAARDENRRRSGLEVSGNPAKFLRGHNLFGCDDPATLLAETIERAAPSIWPDLTALPVIDYGKGKISRIDLTASFYLDRECDVLPTLQAIEQTVWCPYRGRGVFDQGGSTLYFGYVSKGVRAKDWALKMYAKGLEVCAHPLPKPAYEVPGLLQELNRTIRAELTLRTPELKRLGLQTIDNWTPAKVREIWELYMAKLDFGEAKVNLDGADLKNLGLKARHTHAIAAWKSGVVMRDTVSKPTFYRLRKEIKELTGYDIAGLVPVSNVVPLRRLVSVSPASLPRWANQLTAALERAA